MPEVVSTLDEVEALRLAIMFEEMSLYRWQQNKDSESKTHQSSDRVQGGWEEDFTFGGEDDNDYGDRPDITEGADYED